MKVKSLSRVGLFATPWTAAHQARLSMGFARQGYWSEPIYSPTLLCKCFNCSVFFSNTWYCIYFLNYYLFIFWLYWVFVALAGCSLVVASGGYSLVEVIGVDSLVAERRLQVIQTSGVVAHGLSSCGSRALERGSVVVARGLSSPVACALFLDQGSNWVPCIARWILNHWTTREALVLSLVLTI